jgi:seryl-tRNA synthetase
MARNQLKHAAKHAAKKIGAAMGKADRTAHKVAKAGMVAREELIQLSKQVESLKRQVQKTTKRLKNALT